MSARWTAGILIGLPIGLTVAGGFLTLFVYFRRRWPASDLDWGDNPRTLAWLWLFGFAMTLLVLGLTLFPWSPQYHRFVAKAGTVAEVSSRFVAGDRSTSQKFVVRFTDGAEYGCNDTRCALIHAGDHVVLSCIRAWQWTGVPGWDCNFVRDTAAS